MKKSAWILTIVILILLWLNVAFAFQNEPDGFRGLKWGDPPTERMEYFGTFKGNRAYMIPDDKMSMGNAELYLIAYTFYDQPERFMGIGLYFKREENFDLLKMICRGKFGEETQEGFFELNWQGQKAFITLQYDMIEEEGYLAIVSTQITMEQMEAQKKKETEEAEKDW